MVFVCILGAICLYYFYNFISTERITGKWFYLGKPVETFDSPVLSFHGDDCIVKIYKIPKHLEDHFTNPPSSLTNYPLIPLRRWGWKSYCVRKWTKGAPQNYEAHFPINDLQNWDVPTSIIDKVETSLALETSYYAYIGPGPEPQPGQNYYPANYDFYVLDPLNGRLIVIIHDM